MKSIIYERKQYLSILSQLEEQAPLGNLPFAVIGGRRRLGKSYVPAHYFSKTSNKQVIYCPLKLPIGANEADTLSQLQSELSLVLEQKGFSFPISISSFRDLFTVLTSLFQHFNKTPLLVHLDEAQELRRFEGAEGFFATEIDKWREGKIAHKGAILLSGSMWRHLEPMFSGKKRPLYGRETHRVVLHPWRPATVASLITSKGQQRAHDFLTIYAFTGGVPWYLDLLNRYGYLNNAAEKPWEMIKSLYLLGPLRHEEIEVLNTHLRGDARALFENLANGKTQRKSFQSILSPGNYQNFKRFIQSINDNYQFIDVISDPIFPNQTGGSNIRVRDPFLFFTMTIGKKLIDTPPHFLEQAKDQLFSNHWLHHEGWCLEEIIYQIAGEHAATLGWKIDHNHFGFRVTVENSSEMDVVSYSKKEKWAELIEVKRSLQPSYLEHQHAEKKLAVLANQLEKKYPKTNVKAWNLSYRLVYAYDKDCIAKAYKQPKTNYHFELIDLASIIDKIVL